MVVSPKQLVVQFLLLDVLLGQPIYLLIPLRHLCVLFFVLLHQLLVCCHLLGEGQGLGIDMGVVYLVGCRIVYLFHLPDEEATPYIIFQKVDVVAGGAE